MGIPLHWGYVRHNHVRPFRWINKLPWIIQSTSLAIINTNNIAKLPSKDHGIAQIPYSQKNVDEVKSSSRNPS